jgi:hypothetical protein
MRPLSSILFALSTLALASCSAMMMDYRKEIEGNNTGGVIPPAALAGKDAQTLANAHCAKWNSGAKITFSGAEAGGEVVFICEAPGASWHRAPAASQQAPAPAKSKS